MEGLIIKVEGDDNATDPGPSLGSLYVPLLDPEERLLASFYPNCVYIDRIDDYNNNVEVITTFNTSDKVIAFNSVTPPGLKTNWILLLTELNQFYVLCLNKTTSEDIETIVIQKFELRDKNYDDIFGQLDYLENGLINVDPTSRYIVVSAVENLFHFFELKPNKLNLFKLASINERPKETKNKPELFLLPKYQILENPDIYVHKAEGNIINIGFEQNFDHSYWWISILFKNKHSEYEIQFYQFGNPKSRDLVSYVKSIKEPLEEKPTLFIPSNRLLMVCTLSRHHIFVYPDLHLICDTSHINNTIQFDNRNDKLEHTLTPNNGLNKPVSSWIRLDDKNYLLSTPSSEMLKIKLDFELFSNHMEEGSDENEAISLNFKKWEILCIREGFSLDASLNYSQMFYLPKSNSILTCNEFSKIGKLSLKKDGKSRILRNDLSRLPILDIQADNNGDYLFVSSNLNESEFRYRDFKLKKSDCIMKEHIYIKTCHFTIILVTVLNKKKDDSLETFDKIMIYDLNTNNLLDSYKFGTHSTVTCMLALQNFMPVVSDEVKLYNEELAQVREDLLKAFIICSSNAGDDTDDDGYQNTSITLFQMNSEKKIEVVTESMIDHSITSITQVNSNSMAIWGDFFVTRLTVDIYNKEMNKLKFKFTNHPILNTGLIKDPVISVARMLSSGNRWLIVNPYCGVSILNFNLDWSKIKTCQRVISDVLITSLVVYHETPLKDIIITGDNFGNITMYRLERVVTGSNAYGLETLKKINPGFGTIGCITLAGADDSLTIDRSEFRKMCIVGTSQGKMLGFYIVSDSTDTAFINEYKRYRRSLKEHAERNIQYMPECSQKPTSKASTKSKAASPRKAAPQLRETDPTEKIVAKDMSPKGHPIRGRCYQAIQDSEFEINVVVIVSRNS